MKIKSVKLRGHWGILKGLGLEEISLDFEGLDGLIALEGANGMGKTTLLENLQPYRMLPSRPGTLKSHCFLKDSLKELVFEFAGHEYRTVIKTDATTTRPDEGYIYKDGTTQSEVDSKVSNYDAYITDLLGTPALYFSSIFCAQNSRKLSDMKPAELKNLFAEFLRLDRYVKWEETSKAALRICSGAIESHKSQMATIDTKIRMLGNPRGDQTVSGSREKRAHVFFLGGRSGVGRCRVYLAPEPFGLGWLTPMNRPDITPTIAIDQTTLGPVGRSVRSEPTDPSR